MTTSTKTEASDDTEGKADKGEQATRPPPRGSDTHPPHPTTKVIKRYANRKLYDTERSCYVTLEEIAQMIKDGDEVTVVDNKTKDDLTAVTLAQIIVEEEKKVQKMPLKLLRSIIQSGNDAVSGFYEKRVAEGVKNLREDVERRVEGLWKRDDKKDDAAGAPAAEAKPTEPTGDVKAGVLQEFVTHTAEAVETWQKRVDERVRDALSRVQREKAEKAEKEPASTGARPDRQAEIDALRARVAELEKKLSLLEGPKKA